MRRHLFIGIMFAAMTIRATGAAGQPGPANQVQTALQLERLNTQLLEAARVMSQGGSELEALAASRAQLVSSLVEASPGEALRLALPSNVRDSLPAGVQRLIEERVQLTGTAVTAYEDSVGFSRRLHYLDADGIRYRVQVGQELSWRTGARLRVRGIRMQNVLALGGDGSTTLLAPAALTGTTGGRHTAVILVNFRNNPTQPYTSSYAQSVVFGTTDGYFRENSGGATWLTGDVFGWFTIDMDSSVCDTTRLAFLARQAAEAAGASLTSYAHFVYAFPQNACQFWGLGTVGGSPSEAWIRGDLQLDVAGHEMGHNFGLEHSKSLDCGSVVIGTNCTSNEYGDTLDLMGASRGHFNAFQKDRLGWLPASQIVSISGTGTYAIEPFASASVGVKALRFLKSVDASGNRTFYYVEFRQPMGYDNFMNSWPGMTSGVAIHTGSDLGGGISYLLDMTPETTSWYDPALTTGRTFTDSVAGISVTTLSASASGATVSVVVPSTPTCTRANPGVTLSPGAPSAVSPGTTVSYILTTTNNDSAGCPATSFSLSGVVPTGWTSSLDVTLVSLSPGTSTSTAFRVTSPTTVTSGTSTVTARATDVANTSRVGAGSASYSVATPTGGGTLAVQVSTSQTSYARNSTVTATANVMSGSSPAVGAPVSFVFRKANGSTVTATAMTDSRGYATAQLRLRSKDPVGTYQVTGTSGSSSASASFSVR